ncbi:hypothetical protein L204_106013 [Cryptococcus depauperatus]|nr:TKL protein kinase [Cryptococcus depauperatus CBS 7855]
MIGLEVSQMERIQRNRSQHFVSSPRKTASPLITKHSLYHRHLPKKRRIGPKSLIITANNDDSDVSSHSSDTTEDCATANEPMGSTQNRRAIQFRSKSRPSRRKGKVRGRDSAVEIRYEDDDNSSPRKRKRSKRLSGSSGSWVEISGDEGEPEFIAESDQQLINYAPVAVLQRLRKAELIRLWKVAGMWEHDDPSDEEDEEGDEARLNKKRLVDGIIAARVPTSRLISPLPASPSFGRNRRRTPALKFISDASGPRSASQNSQYLSPASCSDNSTRVPGDTAVTPKPIPRTRSRVKLADTILIRSASRRKDRRSNASAFKRSKSMNLCEEGQRARFGENVRSPLKRPLNKYTRSATISSSYTTTPPSSSQVTTHHTRSNMRARRVRVNRSSHKLQAASRTAEDESDFTELSNDELEASVEATPIVRRLRPRTGGRDSYVEDQAGEEADAEATEVEGLSPTRTKRGMNRPKSTRDGENDMIMVPVNRSSCQKDRDLPTRGAKKKAMEKMKSGKSDYEVEEGLPEDGDVEMEDIKDRDEEMDETNISGPSTRSRKSQPSTPPHRNQIKRHSRLPDDDVVMEPSNLSAEDEKNSEVFRISTTPHTTRSGKPFGMTNFRRKMRDPGDNDEEESDEETVFDFDLSQATINSLTRLLRDELVQMCEARGLEVGGTKSQLAKVLLEWYNEQMSSSAPSSTSTARPPPTATVAPLRKSKSKPYRSKLKKIPGILGGVNSSYHVKPTPVLFRSHVHAKDPATPHSSLNERDGITEGEAGEGERKEAELNLDLQELGLEDSVIKSENLVKLEKIGSGGFKDVYVGKLRSRKVAISEFRGHLSEMDIRELKLLAEFSHPNIVRFRGICIPEDSSQVPCMLVSELCENGDLFDYIRNVPCPSLKRILSFMLDIARGLEYLHTRKPSIIHRDCKSSNILINRSGVAKVGDFGLARVKNSTRSMVRSLVGTVNWQAPELWHPAPRYDYKVDVFSAGMVYWEMMSGWIGEKKYPWEGHNEHYIYDAVGAKQRRPSIAGLRKHWGNGPVDLMERMWAQDPAARPTMTEVVKDLEKMLKDLK